MFFHLSPNFATRSSWSELVSSRSYFFWLYRSSSSSATKNIINLILVLTIWWCPWAELSLVLLEEGIYYDQHNVLAILNSSAVNTGVHVSSSIMISSGYMPSNGISGSYGSLFLGFWEISIMVFIVAVSIFIPTNSAREFPFNHTLSSIYCL